MRRLLCLGLCLALSPEPAASGRAAPSSRNSLAAGLERLARTDPVDFLAACLKRYDREVKGYTAVIHRQERLDGRLQPSQEIRVSFREKPFSVLFVWLRGPSRAARVLYVAGKNDNQLLALPAGALAQRLAGIVRIDPLGPEARQTGRFPVTEFGLRLAMERVYNAWQAAGKDGTLHVEYLGKKRIPEVGNRLCYVLRRSRFARPEEDGIAAVTLYVDAENWLQVGTILKDRDNNLIGEYYFRDVHLNPDFPADTFTARSLKP
jgi:hypothetical protein